MKRIIKTGLGLFLLLCFALNANAQCSTDFHSNHVNDSWQSCTASELPDGSGDSGHWIMYDLGADYYVSDLHYWNYNVFGATENGFQNVEIRVSEDLSTWTNTGSYVLEQSDGNNLYPGAALEINAFAARYVLVLAQSNFGGECFGLSEMRFNLGTEPEATGIEDELESSSLGLSLYPNPSNGNFRVDLRESNATEITVVDVLGRVVFHKELDGANWINVKLGKQPQGTYFVRLIDGDTVRAEKLLISY